MLLLVPSVNLTAKSPFKAMMLKEMIHFRLGQFWAFRGELLKFQDLPPIEVKMVNPVRSYNPG